MYLTIFGEVEQRKVDAHGHSEVYENKLRANGRVKTILSEFVVFRKRQNRRGHDQHSQSQKAKIQV